MKKPFFRSFLASATALALFTAPSAWAASASWNVDADGNWIDDANWNPALAPGAPNATISTDTATFSTTLTANRTVTVDQNRAISTIEFGNTSNFGFTLATGQIRMNTGGVIQTLAGTGAHTDTIASNINLRGTQNSTFTFRNDSTNGGLLISGAIISDPAAGKIYTLTLNGTSTAGAQISGAIDDGTLGTLTVVKSGTGLWTLGGANTYRGGTTLNDGTLQLGNNAALGATTSALTINGGTIDVTAARTTTNNNAQNWNGNFTYAGTNTWDTGTGAVTMNASRTVTVSASTMTVGGNITGTGFSLTKEGAGILTLNGANTYSGGTTVNAGVLSIGTTGALVGWNTNGSYSVASGATLAIGNGVSDADLGTILGTTNLAAGASIGFDTTAGNRTYSTALSDTAQGSLGLTKVGTNTLTLDAANTYTGTTWIRNGSISVASINTNLGGTGAIKLGDTATTGVLITTAATGNENVARDIDLAGTTGGGTITNNGGNSTLTINGNIGSSGAGSKVLTLNGVSSGLNLINGIISDNSVANTTGVTISGGKWVLAGNNTYTGNTIVNGGNVQAGHDNAYGTGTVTFSGAGTWNGNGNHTIANNIIYADATNSNNGASINVTHFAGQMSGAGNLTVNGFNNSTVRFSGNNSGWSGNWKFSGPIKLQLNHVKALGTGTTITFNDPNAAASRGTLESQVALTGANALTQDVILGTNAQAGAAATIRTTADMQLNGVVSGSVDAPLIKDGAGNLILAGVNTYNGTTTVNEGAVVISADSGLGSAPVTATAGSLTLNNGALATTANMTLNANRGIALSGTGGQINVAASTTLTYGGNATGTGGLEKAGTGTLVLSAANAYTGGTLVTAGTLVVDGSIGNGAVTVASGATLSGTGAIGGATTISGAHNPGNSPGIQTFGSDLTYSGGSSTVGWELKGNTTTNAPNPGAVFDTIVVGGNLNFSGNTTLTLAMVTSANGGTVDWTDAFWSTDKTGISGWLIYDVAGTTSNFANLSLNYAGLADSFGTSFSVARPGGSFSFYQDVNDIYLNYTAVPEPAAWILAAFGLTTAMVFRRRHRD